MNFRQANQRAWDNLAKANSLFARVATDDECAQPLVTLDTRGWLPASVRGLDVLCLAAGGGWQSILYAVAGAHVTVVDLSHEMLERDRQQAELRGLHVTTLQASMDDLTELADETFDIVHHPVSSCYIPHLKPVYGEVARVLRANGVYISQHKQPTSLQIVERDARHRYVLGLSYYSKDPLPAVEDTSYREPGAVEYLHRWEELIGDLCGCGFVIEDLCEPRRGDPRAQPGHFKHRGMFTPPYVRIKARRIAAPIAPDLGQRIWTPDES